MHHKNRKGLKTLKSFKSLILHQISSIHGWFSWHEENNDSLVNHCCVFFFSQHLQGKGLCQSFGSFLSLPFSHGRPERDCEARSQQTVAHSQLNSSWYNHVQNARKRLSHSGGQRNKRASNVLKPSDVTGASRRRLITSWWTRSCFLCFYKISSKLAVDTAVIFFGEVLSLWLQVFSPITSSAGEVAFLYLPAQSKCVQACRTLVHMCGHMTEDKRVLFLLLRKRLWTKCFRCNRSVAADYKPACDCGLDTFWLGRQHFLQEGF